MLVRTSVTRCFTVAVAALAITAALLAIPAPEAAGSETHGCRSMRVVAHRGHHHQRTENTMGAFRAAVRRGAHAIETDLRSTSDHKIVLMHDRTLGRTTTGRGRVRRMTGAEVHRVRTNDGQRVPYVVQALRYLRHHPRIRGVFQAKHLTYRSMRRLRAQMVRTHTIKQVTLTSTRRTMLRRTRRVMPQVRRVRITWQPVHPRRARRVVDGVMMPLGRLPEWRVDRYRRLGLGVGAMPVDRARGWRTMNRVGIRTVSTNNVPGFYRFCRRVS